MFRLFLIFIIGVLAIIIFSGSWNPFKSSEVSNEASAVYEKSDEAVENMLINDYK
jgi:predicted negative regulator of RcsB-dependent stress response